MGVFLCECRLCSFIEKVLKTSDWVQEGWIGKTESFWRESPVCQRGQFRYLLNQDFSVVGGEVDLV